MYKKIKRFYDLGLWTKEMVKDAAVKGVLTSEQAAGIIMESR